MRQYDDFILPPEFETIERDVWVPDARNSVALLGGSEGDVEATVEAMAYRLGVPLLVARMRPIVEGGLNETRARLKLVLEFVATTISVLFIDDRKAGLPDGILPLLPLVDLPSHVVVAYAPHPGCAYLDPFKFKVELSAAPSPKA